MQSTTTLFESLKYRPTFFLLSLGFGGVWRKALNPINAGLEAKYTVLTPRNITRKTS